MTAADSRAAQLAALATGVALHVAIVVAWAVVFALVAGALRGARLLLAALAFAGAAYAASVTVLPPLLRVGHGARAFPPQVALLFAVLFVGLVLGMRLALSGDGKESGR